jgi:methyl-accepting chemotaxis protein
MKRLNLNIGMKITLLNGVILVLMVGALLYIYKELGKATDVIQVQTDSMKRLEVLSSASSTFSQLRYWMTDMAVSLQSEAEDSAMAEKVKLEKIFLTLKKSNPKLVAELQPKVESFTDRLMSSVDAYTDENRVLGNSLMSEGRGDALFIDKELNKLLAAAKLEVSVSGKRVADANAAIRSISLVLIVVATALGAILSLIFSRSLAKRLRELTVVIGKIAEGDIKQQDLVIMSTDEIGQLGMSFNKITDGMQEIVRQAEDIAAGRLDGQYNLKGDLAVAFQQMTKELVGKKNSDERERKQAIAAQEKERQEALELNDGQEREKREVMERQAKERKTAQDLQDKVDNMLEVVKAAAEGDLTQEISVNGNDAIGQMGRGLKNFLENLRKNISQIATTAKTLAASSAQMT